MRAAQSYEIKTFTETRQKRKNCIRAAAVAATTTAVTRKDKLWSLVNFIDVDILCSRWTEKKEVKRFKTQLKRKQERILITCSNKYSNFHGESYHDSVTKEHTSTMAQPNPNRNPFIWKWSRDRIWRKQLQQQQMTTTWKQISD